jgi:hypothetical protein
MTWGNSSNISTLNLNDPSDSPAAARSDIKTALDELTNVIDGLGTTGGAAKLDASTTKVIANAGIQSTADLTLSPASNVVKLQNVLNLAPTALNSLPSGSMGDIAFITTDEDGDTQNKPVYHNGTAWKYFATDGDVED